jgi:hypothetical protein
MKKLPFTLVLCSLLVSSCQKESKSNPNDDLKIGDTYGGGIYAGLHLGSQIIATPGGCSDSPTPTCAGGTDTVSKIWSNAYNTTSAYDLDDGSGNTDLIVASDGAGGEAASYCQSMDYGGFTDWYLPSKNEVDLLYQNRDAIGGFDTSNPKYYWSSNEDPDDFSVSYAIGFHDGMLNGTDKGGTGFGDLVRCVRKI